ncbi:phage tail protein, partial [Escherichia coli]|nr:phage tail protein [Escherichia coli]
MMIPDDFINLEDLVTVKAKEFNYENLKTFKKGGKSLNKELDGINYSINELCNIYGIDHNEEKHL